MTRTPRLVLALVLSLVLGVALIEAPAAPVRHAIAESGSSRVIVGVELPSLSPARRADRAQLVASTTAVVEEVTESLPAGVTVERAYDAVPAFVATGDPAALASLASHPGVTSITPDFELFPQLLESARILRADEVHAALGATGAGVTVAVIDSGIDTDHPDLVGDIAFEECFMTSGCPAGGMHASGPGSAEDQHGHGTRMASIITSTGGVSPIGIAPDAEVGAYKITGPSGAANVTDLLSSLNDIIANHPEVRAVNMSLSDGVNHGLSCDALGPPWTTAVNTLLASNTLVFAAAGNDGFTNGLPFPACITNVVAVGAVWDNTSPASHAVPACSETPVFDRPTCFSNSASSLDLLAPGGQTFVGTMGGGATTTAGTSNASPHAVAGAAVLWSINNALTAPQIETALKTNGVPRTDPKSSVVTPRVNLWTSAASLIADPDGDGLAGPVDNCPLHANAAQTNTDRNFVDMSPPYAAALDDKTLANSDNIGDDCDPDDDNDGRTDAQEISGTACATLTSSPVFADTDGDRFLDGAECALGTDPASSASKPLLTACAGAGDTDSDKISDRIEACFYNTKTLVAETDADASVDGAKDGCEIASVNGDRTVNSIDQGLLASGISGAVTYHVNVDINKDGVLNSIDQGILAGFIVPPGQCP